MRDRLTEIGDEVERFLILNQETERKVDNLVDQRDEQNEFILLL